MLPIGCAKSLRSLMTSCRLTKAGPWAILKMSYVYDSRTLSGDLLMTQRYKEPRRNVNFSIPISILDRLDDEAVRSDNPKTALVRRALSEYLDKAEKNREERSG